MPFPWKKVKSTNISQLVNHHLHKSQRRRDGSSLVVETGFPTSLIDLFIKNREKLKKPSKKKRETSLPVPFQNDVNDPVIAGSPVLVPSSPQSLSPMSSSGIARLPETPTASPLNCSSPLQSASLWHLPLVASMDVSEIDVGDRDGGGAERKCGAEKVDLNGVILVAVKIFLVAVLTLGTKRLTIGITMSAFSLFFLEYAAKHLCELSKPCSKAKVWLISMVQKIPKFRYKDCKLDQKKGGPSLLIARQEGFPDPTLKCCDSRHQIQEIEMDEPNQYPFTLGDEIVPGKEIIEDSCFEGRSRYQENESKELELGKEESIFEVAKLRSKSRIDKIKSKMKIFVPKKFRSLRKEHNFKEDNIVVCEEQRMNRWEVEWESETTSRLSSTASGNSKQDDGMDLVCTVGGLPEIDEEVATDKKVWGRGTESGMSWSYFVLCSTVLIGLIGGRAFALVLTLSWFLVLKLGKALPWYREGL